MKLNQKLIQQLRNGQIAAENNGTLEQLREVLKEAFPKDGSPHGGHRFYFMRVVNTGEWDWNNKTNLPIVSISDFYQPKLFTGWAKDDNYPGWMMYFEDDVPKYGFDTLVAWQGEENSELIYSLDETARPATHEEIEKHLTQEARRRGYRSGNYKCLALPSYTHNVTNCYYYNEEENKLHHGENGGATNVVFKDGQWAETFEKPNPIHYLVDDMKYSFNYQDLKSKYQAVVNYSDEVFMDNLPEIAHLACIISYFKGLNNNATIGDKGIVHELIHLMTEPDEPTNNLAEIREKFNRLIKLS